MVKDDVKFLVSVRQPRLQGMPTDQRFPAAPLRSCPRRSLVWVHRFQLRIISRPQPSGHAFVSVGRIVQSHWPTNVAGTMRLVAPQSPRTRTQQGWQAPMLRAYNRALGLAFTKNSFWRTIQTSCMVEVAAQPVLVRNRARDKLHHSPPFAPVLVLEHSRRGFVA